MKKIDEILATRLNQKGISKAIEASQVIFFANSINDYFKATKFHLGTLYCEVLDQSQFPNLKSLTSNYIEEINKKIGKNLVKKIYWQHPRG